MPRPLHPPIVSGGARPEAPDALPEGRTSAQRAEERSRAAWHAVTVEEAAHHLQTDPARGLSSTEAALRLERHGRNEVTPEKERWWQEVFESLTQPLVLLLIAVGVLYAVFGRFEDAITIFVVIIAVVAVETVTEARPKRAIRSLAALAAPEATVLRNGKPRIRWRSTHRGTPEP